MLTVFKYPFPIEDQIVLKLPAGATILRAECQSGNPCLWALVDTDAAEEVVKFRIFGTGHPIDPEFYERLSHVDTFQRGSFVWHLFRLDLQ